LRHRASRDRSGTVAHASLDARRTMISKRKIAPQ